MFSPSDSMRWMALAIGLLLPSVRLAACAESLPPTAGVPTKRDAPRILNGRTDTNLTATYGTCFEDEFRHFTLLDVPGWDRIRWAACGNLYAGKLDKVWSAGEPEYSRTLHLSIDGRAVSGGDLRIKQIEHQFDFHRVAGETDAIEIDCLDTVISSLQWIESLKLTNKTDKEHRLEVEIVWQSDHALGLNRTAMLNGFVITDPSGPSTLIQVGAPSKLVEKNGKIKATWDITLAAHQTQSLSIVTQIGWGPLSVSFIKGPISEVNPPLVIPNATAPTVPCDPRFKNILVGLSKPLVFRFKAPGKGTFRVAFGLIENCWEAAGKRVLDLRIEGKSVRTVDLAKEYGRNVPAVLCFDAADADGDGVIELSVHAVKPDQDPNPTVSFISVFDARNAPGPEKILAGGVDDEAIALVHADRSARPAKLLPDQIAQRQRIEFAAVCRMLSRPEATTTWEGIAELCDAKRHALYDRMPRLGGFDPSWQGVWSYTFDLLRAGTYPAQGKCRDLWMAGDLIHYRWTFYWDTALTAHTYCTWDADVAARTLKTFLDGMNADGSTPIHFNPVHVMPIRPQLPNIAMALWDCYLINRDRSLIRSVYPLLARHQRWLDTKWNKTPEGSLAATEHNIDYGTPLSSRDTIWVDMNMFQVNQYRTLVKMAKLLGKDREAFDWEKRAARLQDGIQAYMWNKEKGSYLCVNGKTMKQLPTGSPIEFYAMTVDLATAKQAERLVQRIKNAAKYAPNQKYPYAIPSTPFDDPSFTITDGWGGTIWSVEPYYTVRGLTRYGYQDEASKITRNIYDMVAKEYARTGTIWEQYRPDNGRGMHLGYFTSGITSSVCDMLVRGLFGFERTDDPLAFVLAPRPVGKESQGISNFPLTKECRVDIRMKDEGEYVACQIHFNGLPDGIRAVELYRQTAENAELVGTIELRDGSLECKLPKQNGTRSRLRLRR
ncbi:MAG: trehalase family glycosidase [Thermoguttaceae bacterium]